MDVTDRSLALLALLAARSAWTGAELTERLDVTPRTLRRDIARLRVIGYRIDSTTGTAGGYRLAAGTRLPPLVFDDEEAVAIAALLGQAEASPIEGIEIAAVRALGKLEQVLPRRLRGRVAAVAAVARTPASSPVGATGVRRWQAPIDSEVLARLALASRDGEVIGFDYRDRAGRATRRRVEPHRVITGFGWWYLIGFDLDRADWRTFRLDRIDRPAGTGQTVPPRPPPEGGAQAYLSRTLAGAPYRHRVMIIIATTEEEIRSRVGFLLPSRISRLDDQRHQVDFGADDLGDVLTVALALISLGRSYELDGTPELITTLRQSAATLADHLPPEASRDR
ncbi:helix-turn-helix transcriptional regulator [Microlunatus speluncae]|uniref:helix-turn-helix transcriptional regulator n=1 Tax=Microlunatus speluncae TaxID=2594267 RepID=UPI00126675CE|nr:WYL domain-containing protein [Microlunatus speluncae]